MNAGITTRSGSWSGAVGCIFAIETNNSTSFGRVCLSMNPRKYPVARSSATVPVI